MGSRCPQRLQLSPAAGGSGRRAVPEQRERRRGRSGVTLTRVSGDTAGARSTGTRNRRPSSSSSLRAHGSPFGLCRFSISVSNARDFSRCDLAGGRGSFRGACPHLRCAPRLWTAGSFGLRTALITPVVLSSVSPRSFLLNLLGWHWLMKAYVPGVQFYNTSSVC